MSDQLTLYKPHVRYQDAFLAMIQDYRRAGESRYQYLNDLVKADFESYVRRLREVKRGVGLRKGWVPYTTYWSVLRVSPVIVGVAHLRHRLTPDLRKEGGHIGYAITPSLRGRGYGTRQLALVLAKARARGLDRVLVTCDTDNVASARVIEKNGGVFEGESISDISGKPVSRYWIELVKRET
jgi:predicted acetyltransferase